MTQKQAFKILNTGRSVFLTGPAGSGKTFLLKKFIAHLKKKGKRTAVTATTGLAATHLRGRTIHSWAGIGIQRELSDGLLDRIIRENSPIKKEILATDVLIIDEISMLHDYRLDMIDQVCRVARNQPDKPFGGLQVVLSGDFFQLPPVRGREEMDSKFVVHSEAWQELQPAVCYLSEQYRQIQGNDLTGILNALRDNTLNESHIQKLKSRQLPKPDGLELTELHCHNRDIDQINQDKLEKLPNKPYVFKGEKNDLSKDKRLVDQLVRNCLALEELHLKKGALVMFIKNDSEGRYINGTLGQIIGFQTAGRWPVVKTNAGRTIYTDQAIWTIEKDGLDVATFKQIPLKLAWAITIHKSQGMTLDGAFIDLSKTFEPGMGYVALSRLKSLEDLYLQGFNNMALRMNPQALAIDDQLREQSKAVFTK